jgi:hypothetical protein
MTTPIQLTPEEVAHLLMQPDVAVTLALFNRAQAYQSASDERRMQYLKRVRDFEKISRRRG